MSDIGNLHLANPLSNSKNAADALRGVSIDKELEKIVSNKIHEFDSQLDELKRKGELAEELRSQKESVEEIRKRKEKKRIESKRKVSSKAEEIGSEEQDTTTNVDRKEKQVSKKIGENMCL